MINDKFVSKRPATQTHTPALRYFGSKWRMADWIVSLMPAHRIYVEPFAGSAAILLRKPQSPLEVLNDLDQEVVNFFTALRSQPETLIRAIELTPYSRAEYEGSFEHCDDVIERARRWYVRCWQGFGPTAKHRSGWRRRTSLSTHGGLPVVTWNRTDGLWFAANEMKQVQWECRDALEVIKDYDTPDTLFYVDPPYVLSTRVDNRESYSHEMTDDEHVQLATVLQGVQGKVLLSGYDCDLYRDLYKGWRTTTRTVKTLKNRMAQEVVWVNDVGRAGAARTLFDLQ